jgi:hypothetical protein
VRLTYLAGGNGSMRISCGELFKRPGRHDVLHTPYKGSPEVFSPCCRADLITRARVHLRADPDQGRRVSRTRRDVRRANAAAAERATMHEVMQTSAATISGENVHRGACRHAAEVMRALSTEVWRSA